MVGMGPLVWVFCQLWWWKKVKNETMHQSNASVWR